MAKKEAADLSVEEKLKTLYQLQTTLSGIDEKKALRGELPLEVQDLEDELEGLNIRVDKIKHDIADAEDAIHGNQQLIQEAQKSVERYQHQLDEVKNNREYDTLTKEIEYQSLEIDERKRDLDMAQQTISERQIDLDEKREELDEIMQETREEEDKLKARAKELELKIEPRLLTSFKRIRKNARNGLGIVYVQRDACGGCFNKIPPQRQLDIRMHKKIIVCEYCGRILVDPELAGVTISPAATEEKPKRAKRTTRKKKDAPAED